MQRVVQEYISYRDYGKCVKLSNSIVDIVITVDVGPRIIRYGLVGQKNELCDDAPMTLPVLDEEWRLMGGHRLLHCPEEFPRTYEPDNDPVRWEQIPNGINVIFEKEKISNIRKEMEITLPMGDARVQVLHRLKNNNAWPIETAPWACTVMAAGGTVIVPFDQVEAHFKNGAADARHATLWPYTDAGDKRIKWSKKYVTIGHDPGMETNLKIGFSNRAGWGIYINDGHIFTVKFDYIKGAQYPDNGCSFEVFSCDFMSEIETLAPFIKLNPGVETTHIERWNLFDNVHLESWQDDDIDKMVQKYI